MQVNDRVRHVTNINATGTVTRIEGSIATVNGVQPCCAVKLDTGAHVGMSLVSEWVVISSGYQGLGTNNEGSVLVGDEPFKPKD